MRPWDHLKNHWYKKLVTFWHRVTPISSIFSDQNNPCVDISNIAEEAMHLTRKYSEES